MSALADPLAEARADPAAPVGVVDIGSNSVRLVVYEGGRRAPTALYNEKAICELGSGVARSGRLDPAAVTETLALLRRFRVLANQMGVRSFYAVATAAVREAGNGAEFIRAADQALSRRVTILSGSEEARFAAAGVLSGMPRADGLVGDLGGGSLELVEVAGGKAGAGETAPIGTLRLLEVAPNPRVASELVDETLAAMALPERARGRSLYLVGGTWRALARIHMTQGDYPLHIIDHYEMSAAEALKISHLVRGLSGASLRTMSSVSSGRVTTIPYGALVLERLIAACEPKRVVFSANGLREGLVFSNLPREIAAEDPLIASARAIADDNARSTEHGRELYPWTDPLFVKADEESAEERRLREAACLLGDISWRAHPDYRALRALDIVLQGNIADVDHKGRAFLALAAYARHASRMRDPEARTLAKLIDERAVKRARIIGAAMRCAHAMSAATEGVIGRCPLSLERNEVVLSVPRALADLAGATLKRRVDGLAELLDLKGRIDVAR